MKDKYSRDWWRELEHCKTQTKLLGVKKYREKRKLGCSPKSDTKNNLAGWERGMLRKIWGGKKEGHIWLRRDTIATSKSRADSGSQSAACTMDR